MSFTRERISRIEASAIPSDPPLVAQGLKKCLSEGNSAVLHCMMRIDVEISRTAQLQIAHRVLGKGAQHVIEKAHPGLHLGFALAVNIEIHADGGLASFSLDRGAPLGHVAEAVTVLTFGNKVFV